MAFEILSVQRPHRLEDDQASVHRDGVVSFTQQLLHRHQIHGEVVVMIDRDTGRIAIQPPDKEDPAPQPTLKVRKPNKASQATREVDLRQAMKALGVSPPEKAFRIRVVCKGPRIELFTSEWN